MQRDALESVYFRRGGQPQFARVRWTAVLPMPAWHRATCAARTQSRMLPTVPMVGPLGSSKHR